MSAPASGPDPRQPATVAARAGIDSDPAYGAVVPPPVLSSTFSFAGFGEKRQYDYTRSGNPTRDLLGDALAELEGGAGGVVTATGMGAITLVLSLLEPGDRLVVPHDCYGGSWRLFDALAAQAPLRRWSPPTSPTRRSWPRRWPGGPTMVWIETPCNPLLRITDIAAVADAAHAAGALVVVDNTFLSPALQQPIELGADVVVHSTTKYLNGHSDVVGGAVIARDRGAARAAGAGGPTRSGSPAARSTASSRCAGCARSTRGCGCTWRTPRRSRRAGRPPGGRARCTGRAGRPSRPRPGRAAAAGLRRDAQRRSGRRRGGGARRSSTGCGASRSPSRSAASRAWSRTRRR